MSAELQLDYACRTEAGDKPENADASGARAPEGDLLLTKGAAAAIADGMSASEGGREAAEVCVTGFLNDYFSTPESWTVRTSGAKVLGAINRWLCGQGQTRYDSARGMVTTFSAAVIKSTTAHIFHVGDSRIYLYRRGELEQLTRDHRIWLSNEREFLSRAMGADPHVDIDYRKVALEEGDLLFFSTDGVHEHLSDLQLKRFLEAGDGSLKRTVNEIVEAALKSGSGDNVTCQLVRIVSLPTENEKDVMQRLNELPFPPDLRPGMRIDDYEILRELHASKRSEVFLALDTVNKEKVVLKTPSVNYRDDPEYLDAFLHEEWVGRRVNNVHVVKVFKPRRRRFLYNVSEYIEGKSLAQWMNDHGPATLAQTRNFIAQIIDGLRALHRLEMVHQDLKPDNILIDRYGTLKLIDFGSTRVAGMDEIDSTLDRSTPQGTLSYAAPECLRGEGCTRRSDFYSLGVIAYQLLTGALPYGETDSPQLKRKLVYRSARQYAQVPEWMDAALAKAVNPEPRQRYAHLSEFQQDLSHPNPEFENHDIPLIERNPLGFWKGLALVSLLANLLLLLFLLKGG